MIQSRTCHLMFRLSGVKDQPQLECELPYNAVKYDVDWHIRNDDFTAEDVIQFMIYPNILIIATPARTVLGSIWCTVWILLFLRGQHIIIMNKSLTIQDQHLINGISIFADFTFPITAKPDLIHQL